MTSKQGRQPGGPPSGPEGEPPGRWTTEYFVDDQGRSPFKAWFTKDLDQYEQAVLTAAIENVLEVVGIDISNSEWGKPLGKGLYEFRVRQSLHALRTYNDALPTPAAAGHDRTVLLRVFVTFHGQRSIVLLHGLNKGDDSSSRRQQKEIARARSFRKAWRHQQT